MLLGCTKSLAREAKKINSVRIYAFPSDDHLPTAKKITGAFDIWYLNLPPMVVEVRPRIQVELHVTYQVPPPSLWRDILRVMSIVYSCNWPVGSCCTHY